MAVSPVDMQNTQGQMQAQQMQFQQNQVKSLGRNGKASMTEEQKEKKLRESCEGFESIFIQKMWQQMRATVPKNNLMQGKEEQFWQGMYDQELSKKMASAGGIGLADMMYDQLSRNLVSASRTTASSVGARDNGSGFMAQAAPLLPLTPSPATAQNTATSAKPAVGAGQAAPKASDMYAGAAAQPEAPGTAGQSLGTSGAAQALMTPGAPGTAEGEASPVVQQFLAQLRQQQGQPGQNGQNGQNGQVQPPQAPVQTMTHSVQQGQGGVSLAQRAQREAANKPPVNGVMPAQGMPRSARMTPPPAPQAQTVGQSPVQGQAPMTQMLAQAAHVPGAQAAQNAQATAPTLPNAAAVAAPALPVLPASPVLGDAQAFAAAASAPVNTPVSPEQPQVINTTFTTNIPPKKSRSNRPRGQRMPSGQPVVRNLPSNPASPITNNGAQVGRPSEVPANAVSTSPAAMGQTAETAPMNQAMGAPGSVPDMVIPTVNAAMPLSSPTAAGARQG